MTQHLLDSPSWEEPAWEDPEPGPRRWPWVLLAVLVVAGALYAGAAWWFGDRVPGGTTVAGVDVGGQSAPEARRTLAAVFEDGTGERLTLTSSVGTARLDPTKAGLSVDVPATVDGLVGFTLDPGSLWHHVAGGGEEPAVVTVEKAAFTRAVTAARKRLDAEPTEGSLSVAGGKVAYTEPVDGSTTDVDATRRAVQRWWPEQSTVEVVAQRIAPTTSAEELERVRDDFAKVAVSAPVRVKAHGTTFEIAPRTFAPAIVLEPADDGTLTPRAAEKRLRRVVHAAARRAGAEVRPKAAVVRFVDGDHTRPKVTPSVDGVRLEDDAIDSAVWQAISSQKRTAVVATRKDRPEFTTAVAKRTLPREKVSSFTTYYPAGQTRVHNIKRAAAVLDGTYIKPGEQFSMNGILGERTPEKGYIQAGVINNGRLTENYGGGISQVSTTIFNASFFAGVRLDAWQAHSFYISRYPEGREATISWPDLHNKWTNTLDGGILVNVTATDTSITVTYWGRKKYDVEATKSKRYDVIEPRTIVDDSPECLPQNPTPGFKVDIGRILRRGGKVVERQSFTTSYQPEDDVTCTAMAS
ncbi:VanW family protein [Phycicoccus endophyticus]|uniref:VanW family protein n=1 Tax=Phycicoccus endophyticus TaxID=1690220 RepID=A0A7G9QZ07_9MICO|nr:VanW family protein [Phycicoccus endophyticus]NHI18920.1 hypothetical protein [Phycicoccus endophyticus]QNN48582.1 VanW family protein [Phycicoccus endophyticus]GGL31392.1 vanomycin resistance protein VanB [Phycicoccus endophyticus]